MKLNTKIVSDILNTETSNLLKNTHFLTIIPISFFTCCEKLFSHMNIWIIDKNSMKYHYHRKKIFTVTLTWKILLMQITRMQTLFVKILKQNIQVNNKIYMSKVKHYCQLMYLATLGMCVLKYLGLIKFIFFSFYINKIWQAALKKTKVKLDLLTCIDILLMVEKGVGVQSCYSLVCKSLY